MVAYGMPPSGSGDHVAHPLMPKRARWVIVHLCAGLPLVNCCSSRQFNLAVCINQGSAERIQINRGLYTDEAPHVPLSASRSR